MSSGTVPIQMCDGDEDALGCDEWMLDHHQMGITDWRAFLNGWQFDPRADRAFCPDHTPAQEG